MRFRKLLTIITGIVLLAVLASKLSTSGGADPTETGTDQEA